MTEISPNLERIQQLAGMAAKDVERRLVTAIESDADHLVALTEFILRLNLLIDDFNREIEEFQTP